MRLLITGRGDGLEKALFLANVIRQKFPKENIEITVAGKQVVLKGAGEYRFDSSKGLKKQIRISSAGEIVRTYRSKVRLRFRAEKYFKKMNILC